MEVSSSGWEQGQIGGAAARAQPSSHLATVVAMAACVALRSTIGTGGQEAASDELVVFDSEETGPREVSCHTT